MRNVIDSDSLFVENHTLTLALLTSSSTATTVYAMIQAYKEAVFTIAAYKAAHLDTLLGSWR